MECRVVGMGFGETLQLGLVSQGNVDRAGTLSFLWMLCDRDGDQALEFEEFVICCRLLLCLRKAVITKADIPSVLPQAIIDKIKQKSQSYDESVWKIEDKALKAYRTHCQVLPHLLDRSLASREGAPPCSSPFAARDPRSPVERNGRG